MGLADRPGFRRLQEVVERRTGLAVVPEERVSYLEEAATELSATRKELDLLGWTVQDYFSGRPQEMDTAKRRNLAQKARVVWTDDPQAGAAVALLNDFVFGRGVPRPRAADDEVQKVIDEAWDDPDNQLILTSFEAQVLLGTDLQLQANLFLLMFDDGDDGKVKLSVLDHDSVENAVQDSSQRRRVLYYLAKEKKVEWDFDKDRPKQDLGGYNRAKARYYEHWRNVKDVEAANGTVPQIPEGKLGEGRVYHIAINRTGEMVFGIPEMKRTLRWFSAYNEFLKSRVDMAQAAAAFVMKRKVKGTPGQVARLAAKAVSRESILSGNTGVGDAPPQEPGQRGGRIVTENENVSHESLKLDTGASNAQMDGELLQGVLASATRFPRWYYGGDAGSLAGATAVELPVLKAVEARQEIFEAMFRWFIDRVIEKAVEDGKLDQYLPDEGEIGSGLPEGGEANVYRPQEAHADAQADEERTERDLSYEFSMPSPTRRMMGDLASVIANSARTFDPNNTNIELSRILLTILLGEALEVEDPAKAVERIFPEGYQDPAIAAAQAQQRPPAPPEAEAPGGAPQGEENPYGAARDASAPEDNPYSHLYEAAAVPIAGRDGLPLPMHLQPQTVQEAYFRRRLPAGAEASVRSEEEEIESLWSEEVESVVGDALDTALLTGTNGNGRKQA